MSGLGSRSKRSAACELQSDAMGDHDPRSVCLDPGFVQFCGHRPGCQISQAPMHPPMHRAPSDLQIILRRYPPLSHRFGGQIGALQDMRTKLNCTRPRECSAVEEAVVPPDRVADRPAGPPRLKFVGCPTGSEACAVYLPYPQARLHRPGLTISIRPLAFG